MKTVAVDEWDFVCHSDEIFGVAEAARRLLSLLEALKIENTIMDFRQSVLGQKRRESYRNASTGLLSCVNPDQIGALVAALGATSEKYLAHVGFWAWELEHFPAPYRRTQNLFDEIWTNSEFSRLAISRSISVPVRKVTLPVPIPKRLKAIPDFLLGIADEEDFLVLTSFDFASDFRRKNPAAVVEAFKLAFRPNEGAKLIIKCINGNLFPHLMHHLEEICQGRRDIQILDLRISRLEQRKLFSRANIFVSPHRSEGYGLNIVDAMALGVPVMVTGYSGNMDYTSESNSILVPYRLTRVSHYANVHIESLWAEPDVNFIASKLRTYWKKPRELELIGLEGKRHMVDKFSLEVAAREFRDNCQPSN